LSVPFWRVASYGYPNPFGDKNAKFSWEILQSFVDENSYEKVKRSWQSPSAAHKLDHAAVESRKASFEEFGLLYVLSGSDDIVITPGGQQLLEAARQGHEREFAWIAINLLLRFPLCGPPRRLESPKRPPNFPIYWFLWAALFDLDEHFLWPELERILCTVGNQMEAVSAITAVRDLRAGRATLPNLPVPNVQGAFYNSLNQVVVHAGLYYQLLDSTRVENPYDPAGSDVRRHSVEREFQDIVRLALGTGATQADVECSDPGQYVSRMPMPPSFQRGEETKYFDYLGATVPTMESSVSATSVEVPSLPYGSDSVSILTSVLHYTLTPQGHLEGDIATLCRIGRNQRVIFSHDLKFTYRVKDKQRTPDGKIRLVVNRSKPITRPEPILPYFIEDE
jgi:hypothetical protein